MPSRSNDETGSLRVLGKSGVPQVAGAPGVHLLEAFPNRYQHRDYVVSLDFPEFTSLCPVTGQPDFGTIHVNYIPDFLCVESKSFKLYLFAYRSHQSFMETITNRILEDLDALLAPRWLQVAGLFAPRGATRINVFTEKFKNMRRVQMERVKRAATASRMFQALRLPATQG